MIFMGVQITELLPLKEINISELSGKVIAVDAPIFLYQFLSIIRQRDGTLLMDSNGNVTSHLSGIFFRTIKLIEDDIKLVYVFDGKSPELKKLEQERRAELKKDAEILYEKAVKEEDIVSMKKYAGRTARLTKEMISDTKELISILGLPIIDAESEAEAQAAHLVKKGDAFGVASQDADSLLFGAGKLIRNLSIFGKRKKPNRLAFETVNPEIVTLTDTLNSLGIDQNQLIVLAMLVGTDYNYGGIKGIGPKTALKLVKNHGTDFESVFKEANWDNSFDIKWQEIYELIKNMPVNNKYKLEWKEIDEGKLTKFLVDEHDFSEERISTAIEKLSNEKEKRSQKSLSEF